MNEQEKKPSNPSAFPISETDYLRYTDELPNWAGMTLRDYFANSAMQAMTTSPELMEIVSVQSIHDGSAFDAIARQSYKLADAMLKAREL